MALKNLLPEEVERKHVKEKLLKDEHKNINKKSIKIEDVIKRVEILEKLQGLE